MAWLNTLPAYTGSSWAVCGLAWRGEAGHGGAWPGAARLNTPPDLRGRKLGLAMARRGGAWQGGVGPGLARQGKHTFPLLGEQFLNYEHNEHNTNN